MSPVIGVILMVAIAVILAAVIGVAVLGFGDDTTESGTSGVIVEDGTATLVSSGSSDEVKIKDSDGNEVATLNQAGDSFDLSDGEYSIISVKDGEETVIKTVTVGSGGTSLPITIDDSESYSSTNDLRSVYDNTYSDTIALNTTVSSEGSNSIVSDGDSSPNTAISHSGLSYYPSNSSVIEADVRLNNSNDAMIGFGFGAEDRYNMYGAFIDAEDGMVYLEQDDTVNGGPSTQKTKSASLNKEQWYTLRVEWKHKNDNITLKTNGATLEIDSPELTNLGDGFGIVSTGNGSHIDNIKVVEKE